VAGRDRAIKPKDTKGKIFFVLGPWYHGQQIEDGSSLGALNFGSDTHGNFGTTFSRHF